MVILFKSSDQILLCRVCAYDVIKRRVNNRDWFLMQRHSTSLGEHVFLKEFILNSVSPYLFNVAVPPKKELFGNVFFTT